MRSSHCLLYLCYFPSVWEVISFDLYKPIKTALKTFAPLKQDQWFSNDQNKDALN